MHMSAGRRSTGQPGGFRYGLSLALLVAASAVTCRADAEALGGQRAPSPVTFDIPEQSLTAAIERFSVVSGWQVIYDSSLAAGRRSTPLKGALPPSTALRVMLVGTGLKADYMATDGAMLTANPSAGPRVTDRVLPPPALRGYYGQLQSGLKRALCDEQLLRGGAYRIAVGVWISPTGHITRTEALGTTGSTDVDATVAGSIRKLAFDAPPPGFEQPVVIVVTPDLLSQCGTASESASQ
jgi:hypothetical protein